MLDGFKQVHVQPFMPHRPIESFDLGVLRWLARLNVHQPGLGKASCYVSKTASLLAPLAVKLLNY